MRCSPAVEPLLQLQSVERLSTSEQVAGLLRDILLQGQVPPGTKFPEQALAKAYGVSRNTMREALLVLRGQGLIRHQLHRGAVVAELSDEEIQDVMQARRVLERAGTAAAMRADTEDVVRIQEALEDLRAADAAVEFLRADQRFHAAIVACLKSHHLDQYFAGLQTEQALVRAWRGETSDREHTYKSHAALLKAIRAHDESRADELIAKLIDNAEKRLRNLVARKESAA
jgi:DNA-binding GntR family transcriptional regulator